MISLEEYTWDIHRLIDDVIRRIIDYTPEPKEPYSPRIKGFKGQTYISPGYVYAPYIPLTITQLKKANNDLLQRYGQKPINKKLYGKWKIEYGDENEN